MIMHQCNEREDEAPSPAQQAQQPQPAEGAQGEGAAPAGMLAAGVLGGQIIEPGADGTADQAPTFDRARFTAGVVRFYEAVLKEQVPEKMLRLIDEIAKQERKS